MEGELERLVDFLRVRDWLVPPGGSCVADPMDRGELGTGGCCSGGWVEAVAVRASKESRRFEPYGDRLLGWYQEGRLLAAC